MEPRYVASVPMNQPSTTGSIWPSWLSWLLLCIASSLISPTREKSKTLQSNFRNAPHYVAHPGHTLQDVFVCVCVCNELLALPRAANGNVHWRKKPNTQQREHWSDWLFLSAFEQWRSDHSARVGGVGILRRRGLHAAALRTQRITTCEVVPCLLPVRLVHDAVQPDPRLHHHPLLHAGSSLPTVSGFLFQKRSSNLSLTKNEIE